MSPPSLGVVPVSRVLFLFGDESHRMHGQVGVHSASDGNTADCRILSTRRWRFTNLAVTMALSWDREGYPEGNRSKVALVTRSLLGG
jgi:hypothetical protein